MRPQLLDYVRLESADDGLPAEGPARAPFYLGSLVDDAVDLLAAQAAVRRVELVASYDPPGPCLAGSMFGLRQALVNLCDNGIKFARPPLVAADGAPPAPAAEPCFVRVEVRVVAGGPAGGGDGPAEPDTIVVCGERAFLGCGADSERLRGGGSGRRAGERGWRRGEDGVEMRVL